MALKNKSFAKFIISLLTFKVFVLGMLFTFSPNFLMERNVPRNPASQEGDCVAATEAIIAKETAEKTAKEEVNIDSYVTKDAIKDFWKNRNGTIVGASYFKAKKAIFNKVKLAFMDINSNFRPIFYIEDDEASYPKIFKFIEEKSEKAADAEAGSMEKEINHWVTTFKSYHDDMENLVSEYASLNAYIKKVKDLKADKRTTYPFEIELHLIKDGKEQILKDYAGGPQDLDNVIFKLKGKVKKLKGTSYFRFGAIDTRDFDQALMATRLKSLENEIRNHLATNPNDEEIFKTLLKELIAINRDPQYLPTLKLMAKLEYKEMDAEYRDLFKTAEVDYKKIDAISKKIIENLSPRYQEKLGLNAVKNWVTLMKAGRAGIFVGGLGTIGTGAGALAIRGWTWLNYDEDSTFDIVNAEDEDDFSSKLKKYLKGKYPADLIRRIEKKDDKEMTLKDYDSKNKKEAEILQFVNGVIKERRQVLKEEKLLSELEKKLTTAIEGVSDNTTVEEPKKEKVTKKGLVKKNKKVKDKDEEEEASE